MISVSVFGEFHDEIRGRSRYFWIRDLLASLVWVDIIASSVERGGVGMSWARGCLVCQESIAYDQRAMDA